MDRGNGLQDAICALGEARRNRDAVIACGRAASDIMGSLQNCGILDVNIDQEILDEIEDAIRGHIWAAFEWEEA